MSILYSSSLRTVLFIVFLLALSQKNYAQDSLKKKSSYEANDSQWFNMREIGLNTTTILHNLIPFNLGIAKPGFVGIRAKYYGHDYAFRTCFGSDLFTEINNSSTASKDQFIYGSIGYERRRVIYKRFTYTSGWDAFGAVGVITSSAADEANVVLGLARHYAIEYNINERCYISTEAQGTVGVGTSFFLKVFYPNSIFFNVRF